MHRSWPALPAFVVLLLLGTAAPPAQGQVLNRPEGGQHAVVVGNTLWDLAAHFYGDPFLWPRIYEANTDRIDDPHWIYPGQLIRIPDGQGNIQEVLVVSDQDAGSDAAPAPPRREPERTKFYRDTAAVNRAAEDALANWLAVPQSIFYSAPFLDDSNGMDALGRITGFEGAEEVRAPREGPALYERIVLDLDGTVLAPGTRLQIYALEPRRPEMDGLVATPSGVATILHRVEGGVVASVDAHYHRILKGDLVRPLPTYPGVPGRVAQPVSGGVVTHVMGFAGVQDLHQPGHFLFVDVGRRDGIAVGDELVVVEDNPNARIEGRVQVVGVQDDVATARIVMIRNPVFDHGLRLRMDRKMPAR